MTEADEDRDSAAANPKPSAPRIPVLKYFTSHSPHLLPMQIGSTPHKT